ncbi:MAG: hypothetical protein JWN57_1039, partial [Frankiales bacterium]|nr:hypothetical protein [Frankiales bacterium]
MSDPRDWRDGEPSDPSRPPEVDLSRRRPFPPRPDGGLPRATEA